MTSPRDALYGGPPPAEQVGGLTQAQQLREAYEQGAQDGALLALFDPGPHNIYGGRLAVTVEWVEGQPSAGALAHAVARARERSAGRLG